MSRLFYKDNHNINGVECPYCNYIFENVPIREMDNKEIKCDNCDVKFGLTTTIEVTCEAHKDCELNNQQHVFEKVDNEEICKDCKARRLIENDIPY